MQEVAFEQSLNTKNVFTSALRFAMSTDTLKSSPELAQDLKTSAQQQVEFMLSGDHQVRSLVSQEDVKALVRLGISNVISTLLDRLSSLLLHLPECREFDVLETLCDVEWLCRVLLPRIELMKDFVFKWAHVSNDLLTIAQNCELDSRIVGVKVKLVEVTGKVLEAVGYGIVIVPSKIRVCLLKQWLPFIRRLKTVVDAEGSESELTMGEDLCEFIEGSMVSLVLTLPSTDQAQVFGGWMRGIGLEGVKFPDLSEAFEVWCYRSKSAKRRLLERCDRVATENLALSI